MSVISIKVGNISTYSYTGNLGSMLDISGRNVYRHTVYRNMQNVYHEKEPALNMGMTH